MSDALTQAKSNLKIKVNDFKENVFPALYADPAKRQHSTDTLNAAGLAASESESLEEVERASAALDLLSSP